MSVWVLVTMDMFVWVECVFVCQSWTIAKISMYSSSRDETFLAGNVDKHTHIYMTEHVTFGQAQSSLFCGHSQTHVFQRDDGAIVCFNTNMHGLHKHTLAHISTQRKFGYNQNAIQNWTQHVHWLTVCMYKQVEAIKCIEQTASTQLFLTIHRVLSINSSVVYLPQFTANNIHLDN